MLLLRLEVPKRSRPQDRSPTGPKCEMVRPYTLHIKMRSMQLGLVKWIQHPHLMLTIPSSIPATSLQIPSCLDLRLLGKLGCIHHKPQTYSRIVAGLISVTSYKKVLSASSYVMGALLYLLQSVLLQKIFALHLE